MSPTVDSFRIFQFLYGGSTRVNISSKTVLNGTQRKPGICCGYQGSRAENSSMDKNWISMVDVADKLSLLVGNHKVRCLQCDGKDKKNKIGLTRVTRHLQQCHNSDWYTIVCDSGFFQHARVLKTSLKNCQRKGKKLTVIANDAQYRQSDGNWTLVHVYQCPECGACRRTA